MKSPTLVPVELAGRGYDILIGPDLIEQAGAEIAARRPGARVGIVTDESLAARHLPRLEAALDAAGIRHAAVIVPPGEKTKCYAEFERVCDALIEARIERRDIVLALGGGVVGDLAGFASAAIRRGTGFVQMPTSLLAQVDSSVGGKTGINSRHGKNLVGAFHQPVLVIADTGLLDTLPPREFRAGYAEVVKYGLLGDAPFFDWLEANREAVFAGGGARVEAIAVSCRAKAGIVARDEFETGERMLLNLGHTFGHALEAAVRYDGARLVHGEAVAIGMAQAFRFAQRLGLSGGQDTVRVERHLQAAGLPVRVGEIPGGVGDVDTLMRGIAQDKKVDRGRLTFILPHGIGDARITRDVDAGTVAAFLATELSS